VTEVEAVFGALGQRFNKANVDVERSYHFSLGAGEEWTVHLTKEKCEVRKGENREADCHFEGPAELFLDVWNGRHQLGPMDFLTGKVRSNNPMLLKDFARAFQE
jgi:putative sterol carrier protein